MSAEAEDLVRREAERRGPSEWQIAERRFVEAWGHEPDLDSKYDRSLLLALLRDAVYEAMTVDTVARINRRTERLKEAFPEIHNDGEGTP